MIRLDVVPAGASTFRVFRGRRLLTTSRTPLLSAARKLAEEGVSGDTTITLYHLGAVSAALTATVGTAARLTVKETRRGPVFAPYISTFPTIRASERTASGLLDMAALI